MQILPDSPTARVGDALSSALAASSSASSSSGRDSFGFAQVFANAYETTPAEVTPSLEDAHPLDEAPSNDVLATDDPYISTESVPPSTLDAAASIPTTEIRLTDAELSQVADNLRKNGADDATLQRVKDLIGKPGGVTVADVVKAVAAEAPAKLTEGDLANIKGLADKLDATGALADSVLNDLRDGKVMQAWASMMQALNAVDPKATIDIDKADVLSLGKAMRLDTKTLDTLAKSFAGQETLQLTPDGFKALMVPAQQKLLETETARHKLALSLETAFKPVIKEARERLESEALAGGRTSRRIQQSKVLIQDTATQNGFIRDGEPVAKQETRSTQNAKTSTSPSGEAGTQSVAGEPHEKAQAASQASQINQTTPNDQAKQRKTGQANQVGQVGQAGQAGVVGQAQPSSGQNEPSGQDAGKDKKNTFMGADNAAKNGLVTAKTVETPANPWDALLQRLDLAPTTAVTNGVTPGKLAHGQAPSPLSGRVLSQVEQGMFSALRDGTKRLELQLNPHDLGSVNVQLISRNGEVSALLRPERPETASLLMQQMDQLRAHLEEQGVKVDKVDVQTQLKDDGGMSWQGMNQHNDAQEQQSRSLDFERFRRLGRTRATDIASNIRPELAGMARTATESLHIVA